MSHIKCNSIPLVPSNNHQNLPIISKTLFIVGLFKSGLWQGQHRLWSVFKSRVKVLFIFSCQLSCRMASTLALDNCFLVVELTCLLIHCMSCKHEVIAKVSIRFTCLLPTIFPVNRKLKLKFQLDSVLTSLAGISWYHVKLCCVT